ncbi:MAG TPA: prenyltransferase/squalene oxidase repeat-containing protein [Solirubrobacteraceae bacterium]
MVGYLQNDQNKDGGFGGEAGEKSDPGFTAWVTLALAASSVNPRDQRRSERGAASAYGYLTQEAAKNLAHEAPNHKIATTDLERELLVVDATGTSPHEFGGVDLIAKILERELQEPEVGGVAFPHENGSREAGMNDTIFAVLALAPVHEPAAEAAVQQASAWIEREQNKNGSWPATCPKTVGNCTNNAKDPEGEADMTAAAIEALGAAGRHRTSAQAKGLAYLHNAQNPTEGGFTEQLGLRESDADSSLEANVGSTAWVVQALWAAGENPEEWKPGAVDPLTYIESMQQPDGHVHWKRGQELNGVWMTAYSGPAMAGVPLPIPAPACTCRPPEEPSAPGSGGEATQSGTGVDAGGGGSSAPLFSRPQPQSKGHTPGGARVLASRAAQEKRERRNPGAPRRSPVPTLEKEAPNAKSSPSTRTAGSTTGRLSLPPPSGSAAARGGHEVTGVPIGSFAAYRTALEPGAPGLRGAGQKPNSSVLAIAIAAIALLLALGGSAVERSRPQVIP